MRALGAPGRLAVIIVCALAIAPVTAEEVVVQNDSLEPGGTGAIQLGFVANEVGAAWLTSPCDGYLVGVQVYWRSYFGGMEDSLEEDITVYRAGTFPYPGTIMKNGISPFTDLVLLGPVMQDGGLNEFRYIDEEQSVPLHAPISAGETFIVAFRFAETPGTFGPSLWTDTDGCTSGGSAIGSGGVWYDACALGVSGDLIIRAIVDCTEPSGACCRPDGTCSDGVQSGDCLDFGETFYEGLSCLDVTCAHYGACCIGTGCLDPATPQDCISAGGIYAGDGSQCGALACAKGACCVAGVCSQEIESQCVSQGGTFQGVSTTCDPNPCPQPTGACCVGNGCFANQSETNCANVGGVWHGVGSTCVDTNGNSIADVCEAPTPCPGDANCDGEIDFFDIDPFVTALTGESNWQTYLTNSGSGTTCDYLGNNDCNGDSEVNFFDIDPFVALLAGGATCP